MEQKPIHYDGSVQLEQTASIESTENDLFEITDEMRKNIGRNPYSYVNNQ
ncbi:hypothetical protein [Bacillus methanolicus]|uniref:Uncharacterized protein n=1 Tax=Bacillus methanolicus (strain MGA3 / ATCC 53907) TaxID=796606 RepID=I3DTS2_BACMM|nr:hypothetical protein [Bacillus methanolicus]AIE61145.1 hypothetical protein BMMGA3_13920 [Bacillus methanolicus MGA3]EIJ77643.1 hypothetical protein MGA3_17204 [Bacillus methanolicus MGA3]